MKVSSRKKLTRLVRLQIEVTRVDIDAMLDDYESGMADATTSNAVSRAIRRTCDLDESVSLVRRRGECPEIKIGGYRVGIEAGVTDWLRQVETGFMPQALVFELLVPETLSADGVFTEETIDLAEGTIDAQPKPTAA